MVAPKISSIEDLKVSIPEHAREYLEHQLRHLYSEQNVEGNTMLSSNLEAKHHLDRILKAMKLSPKITFCRVNLILAKRDDVINELEDLLQEWKNERLDRIQLMKSSNSNDGRDVFLKICPNSIFEDCIEIKWCYTNIKELNADEKHSCKIAKGLVLNSNCRHPPPPTSSDTKNRLSSMSSEKRLKRKDLGWPDTHRVVICDRFCGEAVLRGSDIFVRGILCADSGVRAGEEVAVYADLNENGSKMSRGLLLEQYNGHCIFLGTGITGCSRAEMFNQQQGVGVYLSKGIRVAQSDSPPLNNVLTDKMMLQNLPSVLVARALDPKRGEILLDMCCAPGGKTSHMASIVRNDALIVACDKSRKKVLSVRENLKQKGATCVIPLATDSTKLVERNGSTWQSVKEIISDASSSEKDSLLNIKTFHAESFDRILLDPPCSALGLRPKLLVQTKAKELIKHANFQKLFISQAIILLKIGGTMTYSTCTFNACENEDMIRYILDEYPCMKLVPIDYSVGGCGLPGRGLNDTERGMVRRFDPSGEEDTMGFFVGKFVKAKHAP